MNHKSWLRNAIPLFDDMSWTRRSNDFISLWSSSIFDPIPSIYSSVSVVFERARYSSITGSESSLSFWIWIETSSISSEMPFKSTSSSWVSSHFFFPVRQKVSKLYSVASDKSTFVWPCLNSSVEILLCSNRCTTDLFILCKACIPTV